MSQYNVAPPLKDLLDIFADDHKLIVYRPEWRKIAGGLVTGAILLQQIIYRWNNNKRKPFYKFKAKCNNLKCVEGDTWTEELGFSLKEFDTAIKHIGQKLSKRRLAKDPTLLNHDKPVEWWTSEKHLTWFTIHEGNLRKCLSTIYTSIDAAIPCQNGTCPLNDKSAFPEMTNQHFRKSPIGISGNDKSAFSILNDKSAFTEMTNEDLDHKDQRDLSNIKIITTTTTKSIAAVAAEINTIFLDHSRKDRLTPEQIDLICTTHNLHDPQEIVNAVKYFAADHFTLKHGTEPIKSMLALLIGAKNGNGHDSYCFVGGTCIFPEPEPPQSPHMNFNDNWQRILARLQQRVNRPGFNTWLRPLTAELTDQTMTLTVPNETFESWLKEYYVTAIQEEAQQVLNFTPAIQFVRASPVEVLA